MKLPTIPFTTRGLQEKKDELDKLSKERPLAVSQLKQAREMGDLSENGFYKAARSRLSQIDSSIRHLQHLIRFARVEEETDTNSIELGTTVTLLFEEKESTYTLVGEHEANPLEGKISHKSPLGKAIHKKSVGEKIVLETPSGEKHYTVLKIKR